MIYGTYLSASGMVQAKAEQDVIANNLANAETAGFKRLMTLHAERHPQPGAPDALRNATGGNVLLPTHLDQRQGNLDQTGNPLDLALMGDGYFEARKVGGDANESYLTRDGRLATDNGGYLTLAADPTVRVLDDDGNPIQLPAGVNRANLSVSTNGQIRDSLTGQPVATLRLATPADPASLRSVGGGLFAFTGDLDDVPANAVTVQAGYVESSNVDPTTELTRLIEVGRLLETHANLIRYQDTALGKLIEASAVA